MSFLFEYWHYLLLALLACVGLGIAAYVRKNWELLISILAIVGAVGTIAKAFAAGGKAERDKQKLATEKAVREVKKIHEKVEGMSQTEVDRELRKWAR